MDKSHFFLAPGEYGWCATCDPNAKPNTTGYCSGHTYVCVSEEIKNLTILTSIKTHKMSIGLIRFFILDVDMAYQFRTKDREAAVPLPNKVWL